MSSAELLLTSMVPQTLKLSPKMYFASGSHMYHRKNSEFDIVCIEQQRSDLLDGNSRTLIVACEINADQRNL